LVSLSIYGDARNISDLDVVYVVQQVLLIEDITSCEGSGTSDENMLGVVASKSFGR
jgi:hypothetical protein